MTATGSLGRGALRGDAKEAHDRASMRTVTIGNSGKWSRTAAGSTAGHNRIARRNNVYRPYR